MKGHESRINQLRGEIPIIVEKMDGETPLVEVLITIIVTFFESPFATIISTEISVE